MFAYESQKRMDDFDAWRVVGEHVCAHLEKTDSDQTMLKVANAEEAGLQNRVYADAMGTLD